MLLEYFLLPSLSLLHKISLGTINAVKCAQTLRNDGTTSNNVYLMFDKMYLQKYEEYFGKYFGGDFMGHNSEGELCKGLVCFMIIGLKLSQSNLSVRAIICDNHP